jgi:hypothetical protein
MPGFAWMRQRLPGSIRLRRRIDALYVCLQSIDDAGRWTAAEAGLAEGAVALAAIYDLGKLNVVGDVPEMVREGTRLMQHSEEVQQDDHEDRHARQPKDDIAEHLVISVR